jgi:hypothetical protein
MFEAAGFVSSDLVAQWLGVTASVRQDASVC